MTDKIPHCKFKTEKGCLGFGFGLSWFCFGQRDVGMTYTRFTDVT